MWQPPKWKLLPRNAATIKTVSLRKIYFYNTWWPLVSDIYRRNKVLCDFVFATLARGALVLSICVLSLRKYYACWIKIPLQSLPTIGGLIMPWSWVYFAKVSHRTGRQITRNDLIPNYHRNNCQSSKLYPGLPRNISNLVLWLYLFIIMQQKN